MLCLSIQNNIFRHSCAWSCDKGECQAAWTRNLVCPPRGVTNPPFPQDAPRMLQPLLQAGCQTPQKVAKSDYWRLRPICCGLLCCRSFLFVLSCHKIESKLASFYRRCGVCFAVDSTLCPMGCIPMSTVASNLGKSFWLTATDSKQHTTNVWTWSSFSGYHFVPCIWILA